MRPIREKIVNIQLFLYIVPKIVPLKKSMTLLHCHQILKILFLQVNFAPVYPKKGRHYDHWYHVFGNYSTESI